MNNSKSNLENHNLENNISETSTLETRNTALKPITSVGIIGCGWLGSALAAQLVEQGIPVLATRSNSDNVADLTEQLNPLLIAHEIKPIFNAGVLTLPTEQSVLNAHPVFNQQCLVIAITPQFRHGRVDYADKVQQLILAATASDSVEKIILLSSTAVYNGLEGKVNEAAILDLSADKVSILNAAEQAVLGFNSSKKNLQNSKENNSGYVLRLSGLVGPNRHPGKFLLNGRMLQSPQAIVNLIHQQDAVGLILALLENGISSHIYNNASTNTSTNASNNIFNGVSSTRVTKKEYYQAAAKAVGLPTPTFIESENILVDSSKAVSGKKTREKLRYDFIHDDLLRWVEQEQ